MRKNKMMRTASALLVATLLTTSVISGTFAKYVTTNSGTDSATVAKFGVTINVSDDMGLFKTSYAKDNTSATSANTVVSASADRKIAPGTKGSMSFSITGTPEVATKLDVVVENATAAHLAAGTYELKAGSFAEEDCKVVTTADYEPIKWYFGTENPETADVTYDKTLSTLETTLENLTKEYAANETLNATYYIGWKWDHEVETDFAGTWNYNTGTAAPYTNAKIADFLDTYMGNQDTLQTETFDLKISVTQID